jgi:hypothetical protein
MDNKQCDRCAPSSELLPKGAVLDDPPGWRLTFRVIDALSDDPKHFARIVTLTSLIAGSLVVLAFVVGPWAAGGIGAAVAAMKSVGAYFIARLSRATRLDQRFYPDKNLPPSSARSGAGDRSPMMCTYYGENGEGSGAPD